MTDGDIGKNKSRGHTIQKRRQWRSSSSVSADGIYDDDPRRSLYAGCWSAGAHFISWWSSLSYFFTSPIPMSSNSSSDGGGGGSIPGVWYHDSLSSDAAAGTSQLVFSSLTVYLCNFFPSVDPSLYSFVSAAAAAAVLDHAHDAPPTQL